MAGALSTSCPGGGRVPTSSLYRCLIIARILVKARAQRKLLQYKVTFKRNIIRSGSACQLYKNFKLAVFGLIWNRLMLPNRVQEGKFFLPERQLKIRKLKLQSP